NPEQEGDVRRIIVAADRLLALIDDVLDLSSIDTGQLTVRPERVCVAHEIAGVRDALLPEAQAKGLGFEVVAPEDLPPLVADPAR
ncbi:hypothetical protein OFM36_36190, partial [Escherichia coli]|nr:hypothetical protein [Escherichia coli]